MGHLSDPGPDEGTFSTADVQGASKPTDWKFSRTIALTPGCYETTPNIGIGINAFDTAPKKPDNIRLRANVSNASTETFDVCAEQWYTSNLNSARLVWLENREGAKDTQIGEWYTTTREQKQKGQIKFKQAGFESWLVDAYASDVTAEGFTCHIDTWTKNKIWLVGATWIAIKKDKRNMHCGRFGNIYQGDAQISDEPLKITFPSGKFKSVPVILSGLNKIDIPASNPVKVASVVQDVSKDGFTWTLETGTKSACSAYYVAIG